MCGGYVSHDESQNKAGSFDVVLTADGLTDRLFSALPDTFVAQYGHKDSVTSLPRGATLLAQGPACRFSALRYGRSVYSVQFHPELDADGVMSRIRNTVGYLPAGVDPCSVVRPSPHASRIVPLFVECIVGA
jgi:GMP synthase (glutamine-hydrolysing)